jgi:signal transduction histidine kinase
MFNNLFVKISLSILLVITVLALAISYISINTINSYYTEANQKLHANLAQYTTDHISTFKENGELDSNAIADIMHSMMIINPDVEVYLLGVNGNILGHVAPYKKVVRESVSLAPIKKFLDTKGEICVKGDDPRQEKGEKIFSAAPILNASDEVMGYYYIILASEERDSVFSSLWNSFAFKSGASLFFICILSAILISILLVYLITRNLNPVLQAMQDFQNGKYEKRITQNTGVFSMLSATYNKMATRIQESIKKIESVDNFRKELIANVSHDLRTPLAVVQGYSETLLIKDKQLDEKDKLKYINNIHENTIRMGGLINQLFELSKLEGNQIALQKEAFSLPELVRDTLDRFQILLDKKGIQVEIKNHLKGTLAYGDIALVERVIQNLLDNAVKFSEDGSLIEIYIEDDKNKIKFSIADKGQGISESKIDSIFDRYITDTDNTSKIKGTGLGLAIAKKIIELHGSSIKVKSKLNVGTTFSFFLQNTSEVNQLQNDATLAY